jgi:uncharacterized membrane protein
MLTLTASEADARHGTGEALNLVKLHIQVLLQLRDAAVVSWEAGQKKLKNREPLEIIRAGAGSDGFWGTRSGPFFRTPLLGMMIGALLASMRHVSINDDYIREVRSDAGA